MTEISCAQLEWHWCNVGVCNGYTNWFLVCARACSRQSNDSCQCDRHNRYGKSVWRCKPKSSNVTTMWSHLAPPHRHTTGLGADDKNTAERPKIDWRKSVGARTTISNWMNEICMQMGDDGTANNNHQNFQTEQKVYSAAFIHLLFGTTWIYLHRNRSCVSVVFDDRWHSKFFNTSIIWIELWPSAFCILSYVYSMLVVRRVYFR